MLAKKVTSICGEEVFIDESTRKLYDFNNKRKEVTYSAQRLDDGMFWTCYTQKGTINDIELKLRSWNNLILLAYARLVGFKASENDPDKKIWKAIIKHVKDNEEKFFTKTGDFRKSVKITDDDIKAFLWTR
jgi:hypothetical protein